MHHFFKIIFVLLAFSISSKNNFNVEKPNFIIYLSDDQDFLDYNIYGNQNVQSDGVNRLAREGLVLQTFILDKLYVPQVDHNYTLVCIH